MAFTLSETLPRFGKAGGDVISTGLTAGAQQGQRLFLEVVRVRVRVTITLILTLTLLEQAGGLVGLISLASHPDPETVPTLAPALALTLTQR